jgi:hypothetical protein
MLASGRLADIGTSPRRCGRFTATHSPGTAAVSSAPPGKEEEVMEPADPELAGVPGTVDGLLEP